MANTKSVVFSEIRHINGLQTNYAASSSTNAAHCLDIIDISIVLLNSIQVC